MCVCVFLGVSVNIEYQNPHPTSKVRTFWGGEEILDGPRVFEV